MVQQLNDNIFSPLRRQSLPSYTTYVPDSKIRLALKGIYFHYSTVAWNSVNPSNPCSSYFYNQFGVNKEKELNAFILGKAPGGGCGPSPFYLNMMGSEHPDTIIPWEFTVIFAHEIGHCLGLSHTHEYSGLNDSIPDTPPELVVGWVSANSTTTGNNLMGLQIDRTYLSKMQLEVMHGRLRTIQSGLWDMRVAAPTPRAIVNGYDHGFFAIEENGDLMRAYWTLTQGATPAARWNFEIMARAELRLVPGSLVSTSAIDGGRAFGVNDRYEIVRTDFVSSQLSVMTIGGPGVTPGSLVVDDAANDLYGVDLNRRLFRIPAVGGPTTIISGPLIAAGSLVATNWNLIRIFGVTENYKIVYVAFSAGSTTMLSGVSATPGSIVDAGGKAGLFAVDQNNNLIHVDTNLTGAVHAVSISGRPLVAGSLVWSSVNEELYGVSTDGQIARLFANGLVSTTLLPPLLLVVPGSLVDGRSNGLFGVTPSGDLIQISLPAGAAQVIPQNGGQVIPGSLISDSADGGRAYGVNTAGQIVNSWKSGSVYNYGIVE